MLKYTRFPAFFNPFPCEWKLYIIIFVTTVLLVFFAVVFFPCPPPTGCYRRQSRSVVSFALPKLSTFVDGRATVIILARRPCHPLIQRGATKKYRRRQPDVITPRYATSLTRRPRVRVLALLLLFTHSPALFSSGPVPSRPV